MIRWLCALVTGGVVSGFALLLVTGEYANDGPVVLYLSERHGLHAGDFFVIAGWAAAMLALGWLVLAVPRRAASWAPVVTGRRRTADDPLAG